MVQYYFSMSLLIVFGFVVTYSTIPVLRRVALEYEVVSSPGGRRSHNKPTPLLGGLAIFLPFAAVFITFFLQLQKKLL
jgi:UDP-GlcNAc:undecaprenyl-phosphate GlcNAc-1-phosphate transferase